jgi:hypothetical protein
MSNIIDQLKSKINDIKDKIKSGEISEGMFAKLTSKAKDLQTTLDGLLAKKGILTQSDVNNAYEVLQDYKRKELEAEAMKSKRKLIIYTLAIVGVGVGAYMYFKRK